jgi:multiple sugar transport system permease protein
MTEDGGVHRMKSLSANAPVRRLLQRERLFGQAWSLYRFLFLVGVTYVILLPLLTQISSSFMQERDLYDNSVLFIPRHFTLENYRLVFRVMDYWQSLVSTLSFTVLVSLLQLASSTMVGYGLARFKAPGSGLLFALVILTLVVPQEVVLVPLYLNFRFFNVYGLLGESGVSLIGTFWPTVLTSLTAMAARNGLFVFIMRQFFRGMPADLEEAAYVDGAGFFQTFFRIMVPSAVPGMVVVFLFAFVWQWNDYLFTTTFMQNTDLLVCRLETVVEDVFNELKINLWQVTGPYGSLIRNTASLLFIGPLLLMYAFLQRYFVESIERTGLVG